MGYTPAFDTIYTGTLYGRWPAAPVWASLLPLLNRHGEIDMSIEAICGMTGWPRDLLEEGIRQLMEPDPHSRTPGHNGVRLEPLVQGRPWGWRAVNHPVYREKARKMNYDAARTESGKDAERKRQSRAVPTHPDGTGESRAVPLSDSDSDSNTDSEKNPQGKTPVGKNARKRATSASTVFPLDFALDDALRAQALKRAADCDVDEAFVQFRAHHQARESKFVNWRQAWTTWVGNFEQFGYPKRKANGVAPGMEGVRW